MDCAIAVQPQLNANSKSNREEIRAAYKRTMGASAAQNIYKERCVALEKYECEHGGEVVSLREVRDSNELFSKLSLRTVLREIQGRGWKEVSRGKYRVPGKEEAA